MLLRCCHLMQLHIVWAEYCLIYQHNARPKAVRPLILFISETGTAREIKKPLFLQMTGGGSFSNPLFLEVYIHNYPKYCAILTDNQLMVYIISY